MSGPELVVTGKEDVLRGLDAIARAAGDLTEPNRRIVGRLLPSVVRATPRRTGALAVSWSGGVSSSSATVSSPLRYAPRMARTITEELLPASAGDVVKAYEDHLAEAGKRADFGVSR